MAIAEDSPDLELAALEKIAEEIPSGVSAEDVGSIIKSLEANPDEVAEALRENIAEGLKDNLRTFWKDMKIREKLDKLKTLERIEGNRLVMSGQEIRDALEYKYLLQLKETLKTKTDEVMKENVKLQESLDLKVKKFQQQIDNFNSCNPKE